MRNDVVVASTFSKMPDFFGKNFPIKYLIEGKGAFVKTNTNIWLLDWISGLGANLLGYESRYSDAGFYHYVANAIRKGLAFSLPTEYEYSAAEKLVNLLSNNIKHWNNVDLQVRWVLSGSDACNAAIRLAKAVKRGIVFSSGYHGQADQFIAATPPAHGLYNIAPVVEFSFGTLPVIREGKEVSAVIIEVPPEVENTGYFVELRNWCDKNNALLIVDEVVTGLRYARGGACQVFDIKPDIVCMGKSLANGLPIGVVIAPKELMNRFNPEVLENNDPVFISSTNVGNLASMAAACFMLDYVANNNYIRHIESIGYALQSGLFQAGFKVIGNSARNLIIWESNAHKGFVISEFEKRNILLNRPNFPNMAHTTSDVEHTVSSAKDIQRNWLNLSKEEVKYWEDNSPITMFRNR